MAEMELAPGHVIAGRYRLRRRIGAGGMGAVYEAEHLELGRVVAVKILLPEFSANPSMAARFMREARAAAQVGHPGIVQVFDLGTDGQLPFLVMERLEGEELGARIGRASPLPISWVVAMAKELCDALQAAHDHGIVHRDLKPSNVFLARQGRRDDVVKVLDFGIAKLLTPVDDVKTTTGQVFGTPTYMAPEQLRDSKEVDGRADVYAIGCVLFQALVGHPPFEAATFPDLIFRICAAPRPRVHELRGDVPRALGEVVLAALALEPGDRPKSPAELARSLGDVAVSSDSGSVDLASAKTEAAVISGITPPPSTGGGTSAGRGRNLTFGLVALGAAGTVGALAVLWPATGATGAGTSAPPPPPSQPTTLPTLVRVQPTATSSTLAPSATTSASASSGPQSAGSAPTASPSSSGRHKQVGPRQSATPTATATAPQLLQP